MSHTEKVVETNPPPVPVETVERGMQEKLNGMTREYGFELVAAETALGYESFHATLKFASTNEVEALLAAHVEMVQRSPICFR